MISIVISTYNGSGFIKKQLDSIKTQTHLPDEVIIRDDCSTDGTVKIISDYIKKHNLSNWSFSINEKNLGYKENFYKGVADAKGDYIFLCDQDDVWESNKIKKMIDVFETHPEIWALNCGLSLIDGHSKPINITCEKNWTNCNFLYSEKHLNHLTFFTGDYILRHNIGPGCAMAIDRRTADGFIKTYNMSLPHDWHMNMIAAVNGGCAFLNEQLILYRKHDHNAIGANTGAAAGIKKKTNDARILDFESRLNSYEKICQEYRHKSAKEEIITVELLNSMIEFYRKPSLINLRKAKKISGYYELAKKKVQLWELFVALHIDGLIRNIVK